MNLENLENKWEKATNKELKKKNGWILQSLTICWRRGNREPEMADFIQFVNNNTLIVIDPVFSKEAEKYIEKKSNIYCDERHKQCTIKCLILLLEIQ